MIDYEDLLGIPFRHGGRSIDPANQKYGVDCWGLCIELLKRQKRIPPEIPTPDSMEDRHELIDVSKNFLADKLAGPEVGAVVLFQIMPKFVSHCGICLGDGKFIHILAQSRVSVERLDSLFWKDKVRGFYRIN
jgi:cell wall-associated NlpC family hydrolase